MTMACLGARAYNATTNKIPIVGFDLVLVLRLPLAGQVGPGQHWQCHIPERSAQDKTPGKKRSRTAAAQQVPMSPCLKHDVPIDKFGDNLTSSFLVARARDYMRKVEAQPL